MPPLVKPFRRVLIGPTLLLLGVLCWTPSRVRAQPPISADTNVRMAQQWEDMLLLHALDYLQLTPQQCQGMQVLAEAKQMQAQEIDYQRTQLKKIVQEQYQAFLKGKPPTASEELAVIQKEKRLKNLEAALAEEVGNRLTPRFTQLLTRRQIARAWHLMQNQTMPGEVKCVALYEPASGFVLPTDKARELREALVRMALRHSYSEDVLDEVFPPSPPLVPDALQTASESDASATLLSSLFSRMQVSLEDTQVSSEMRVAINQEADQLRAQLSQDADAYLKQASITLLNTCMRHWTQRLFLSPRLKEILAERTHP